jgi:hypothetical protein
MYTESTTLQYGPGSNYGYVCGGGHDEIIALSIIDLFQFPFDDGIANQVGDLSGSRAFLSANNSSIHGYVCGGWSGSFDLSTIDRFQFPFGRGTAYQVGNLSGSRCALSANNSSTHGYVCGGWNISNFEHSTIDRFQFPFDDGTANQMSNLSGSRSNLSANNSSIYGYVCGGYRYRKNYFSTIDRFQFPFENGTINYVGNLSGSRDNSSANNSSTYGYICGGRVYDDRGRYYLSTIDRFQFPFDSGTANQVGNLSGVRDWLSANNSSTYGYTCGGEYSYNNITFSTIDRFQFPFDNGTASHVGNLSGSRDTLSAVDGVDFVTIFT